MLLNDKQSNNFIHHHILVQAEFADSIVLLVQKKKMEAQSNGDVQKKITSERLWNFRNVAFI